MAETSKIISELCHKICKWEIQAMPEFATYIGFSTDDTALDPYNVEFYATKQKLSQEILEATGPLKEDGLSSEDVVTLHMLRHYTSHFIEALEWEPYLHGMNFWEGPDWVFISNITRLPFKTETDYRNYIARMEKIPKAMEEITGMMKIGIEKSIMHYKKSVAGAGSRLRKFTTFDVTDSVFFTPFLKIPESIPETARNTLFTQGQETIKFRIFPSLLQSADFVEHVYLKHCRPLPAISSLPGGRDRYSCYLRFFAEWNGTAEELHEIGQKEVEKINKRIEQLKENIGFHGTHDELVKHLEQKEEFIFKTKEELTAHCDDLINNRIRKKMKGFFPEPPFLPLKYEFLDKAQPAPAIYNAPMAKSCNGSGPQTGLLCLTNDLRVLPSYVLPSLMLHETDPGHHLQACYTVNEENLPNFRRFKDDRRYFEAPARYPMNSAYTEGWGLYCEYLGQEMGVYKDDYDLLGYLIQDVKRAIRVVVDTGIHAIGWTEEEAFAYMKKNAPYRDTGASNEIVRYITWPGQCCSYKVGYFKIQSLRAKAEKVLGDKFEIGKFHEACLKCGQVPLEILEGIIDDYIKHQQEQ